ncbi:hypothetical protein J5N97_011474 [Dioscorea zingiberensis]|uniref:Phytocyanin domain-containing protein n=1 Tax=Dioscorea zingiberensis TaxID=325984 RepID=A0A9D5D255_9LILI|nr:hypothetical protein J5N97_011474 [Dioscorea zingiberensis]
MKARRCLKICCCATAIIILILIITLVILYFTMFKLKQPQVVATPVSLQSIDFTLLPVLKLHVTIGMEIDIKNPNYGGFKYDNSTTLVYYRGSLIAEALVAAGMIGARSTENVSTSVDIFVEDLAKNPLFLPDVFSGSLNLTSSSKVEGKFKVGGSKGWTVPTDAMSYNQWAESNRFQIGDSLLFVYHPVQDSVLLVDEDAYKSCNTSSFIDVFDDGNTVFTLTHSGTFYFISGNHENCLKNESLVVVVMAERTNASAPSPPPSPSVLAPPPPPPPESMVFAPTISPVAESTPPPPNGASSSRVMSFMSSFGALLGLFIPFVL